MTIGRPWNYPCFRASYSFGIVSIGRQYRSWTEKNHTSFCVFLVVCFLVSSSRTSYTYRTLHIHRVNRDVLCQLPPKPGHPPQVAARLKKLACGMSDVLRRWWHFWTKHVVPTRADRSGYVLYSTQTCNPNWNRTCSTRGHGTKDISLESRVEWQGDAEIQSMLDPIEGRPPTGKSVAEIINFFVNDLFGKGGTEMEQCVLARLTRKHVQVGSEEWNGVLFTGQRIRWTRDLQSGPTIDVS